MTCENCDNIDKKIKSILKTAGIYLPDVTRPKSDQVRLYIYQELETSNPSLYPTFVTQDEARDLFGGKFAYRPLIGRDLTKGL